MRAVGAARWWKFVPRISIYPTEKWDPHPFLLTLGTASNTVTIEMPLGLLNLDHKRPCSFCLVCWDIARSLRKKSTYPEAALPGRSLGHKKGPGVNVPANSPSRGPSWPPTSTIRCVNEDVSRQFQPPNVKSPFTPVFESSWGSKISWSRATSFLLCPVLIPDLLRFEVVCHTAIVTWTLGEEHLCGEKLRDANESWGHASETIK